MRGTPRSPGLGWGSACPIGFSTSAPSHVYILGVWAFGGSATTPAVILAHRYVFVFPAHIIVTPRLAMPFPKTLRRSWTTLVQSGLLLAATRVYYPKPHQSFHDLLSTTSTLSKTSFGPKPSKPPRFQEPKSLTRLILF